MCALQTMHGGEGAKVSKCGAARANKASEDAVAAVIEDGSRDPLFIRERQSFCARVQGVGSSGRISQEQAAREQRAGGGQKLCHLQMVADMWMPHKRAWRSAQARQPANHVVELVVWRLGCVRALHTVRGP